MKTAKKFLIQLRDFLFGKDTPAEKIPSPVADLFVPGSLRITNAEMRASVSLWDEARRLEKAGAPIYEVGYFTPEYEVMAGWELRHEVEHETYDTIYTWKRKANS